MAYSNQGRLQEQISFLRRQFLQDGGLPFTDGKRPPAPWGGWACGAEARGPANRWPV